MVVKQTEVNLLRVRRLAGHGGDNLTALAQQLAEFAELQVEALEGKAGRDDEKFCAFADCFTPVLEIVFAERARNLRRPRRAQTAGDSSLFLALFRQRVESFDYCVRPWFALFRRPCYLRARNCAARVVERIQHIVGYLYAAQTHSIEHAFEFVRDPADALQTQRGRRSLQRM